MLKISISGIRGMVPDSLTPEVCLNFAKAFGTYMQGETIVVGTDTRSSSEFIKGIVLQGLLSSGCKVIDLGVATTPTVGIVVRELQAQGGLVVTASHNPEPWNGLKFIRKDGIFLNSQQTKKLLEIYENKTFEEAPGGSAKTYNKASEIHINKILKAIDPKKIRKAKFKVVIDSCNGAGSVITPLLLKELGCIVIELNTNTKKLFPRGAEPTPENLTELAAIVKKEGADIGFAQDPDADRLAIVTETGVPVSEEYTLALSVKYILQTTSSSRRIVVTNLSTTSAIDHIAREFGAVVIRTKIGEVHVAEEIKAKKALIGGEGNGGVIYPKVGFNRDSLSGIALILMYLANQKNKISELVGAIPEYVLIKKKITCDSSREALDFLENSKLKFQKDSLDLTEGVKVIRKIGWLHLRASNTEPIIRIFAECKDKKTAEEFIQEALES
ncbi:phosphoglucosamine mutase [candidate division WOR-1 bacterium RIFOXYA2_FULL_37_7]|nr:MAG: phosphoglucosamine mutase [candidate division WOR-1 bacterium RIFOXYA2_FULL_37_7]